MVQITPENILVFYSFESILSGLLAFVLLWLIWKRRAVKETKLPYLLASLFTLAFALFLCSSLNFYEFYHQEKLLQHDPEDIACGFFLLSAVLLGIAFSPPSSHRAGWRLVLVVGATLGLVDLVAHLMGYGEEDVPLHFLAACRT